MLSLSLSLSLWRKRFGAKIWYALKTGVELSIARSLESCVSTLKIQLGILKSLAKGALSAAFRDSIRLGRSLSLVEKATATASRLRALFSPSSDSCVSTLKILYGVYLVDGSVSTFSMDRVSRFGLVCVRACSLFESIESLERERERETCGRRVRVSRHKSSLPIEIESRVRLVSIRECAWTVRGQCACSSRRERKRVFGRRKKSDSGTNVPCLRPVFARWRPPRGPLAGRRRRRPPATPFRV